VSSRQYLGGIKKFKVDIDDQDRVSLTLEFEVNPKELDDKLVDELRFLNGVKKHGLAILQLQSAQGELPLEPPETREDPAHINMENAGSDSAKVPRESTAAIPATP